MDKYKQELHGILEGSGGFKCPCCNPYHSPRRKAVARRLVRSRMKQAHKKNLKEEV